MHITLLVSTLASFFYQPASAAEQATPLVVLSKIAPTVLFDMRYAGEDNFIGRKIKGYNQPVCMLSVVAAKAVAEAQREAERFGLSLKVYDCYRPQKAVDDFVAWAKDLNDTKMQSQYYPNVPKSRLFADGYIAEKSGHSRGSTLDLTLVDLNKEGQGKSVELDMGTPYDYFDPLSHTENPNLSPAQRQNRLMLKMLLEKNGFLNLKEEWWHFTLKDEPFRDTYFDLNIDVEAGMAFRQMRFVAPLESAYESPVLQIESPMDRAVISWNVLAPAGSQSEFSLRFRKQANAAWSPWFIMGKWGDVGQRASVKGEKNNFGSVDVDTLITVEPASEWQFRVSNQRGKERQTPKVYAVSLAFKNSRSFTKTMLPRGKTLPILPVPSYSQFEEIKDNATLASRICSPTSVAMLAKFLGSEVGPLAEFVNGAYDVEEKIYGNWPLNTAWLFQTLTKNHPSPAYRTYVRWYDNLDDLLAHVDTGIPTVVSIKYQAGELDGAPKPTDGHLLLIRGGDATHVYVNDPAAPERQTVARKYPRQQFLNAWKGVAYVVEKF